MKIMMKMIMKVMMKVLAIQFLFNNKLIKNLCYKISNNNTKFNTNNAINNNNFLTLVNHLKKIIKLINILT